MTPLEAEIGAIIAREGPISIARYMELCLGHPAHGYYTTRDPFGARGDFVTAPEISQMFGELIGLWAATVWQKMDAPGAVHFVELGPGRGTLMADALRAATIVPAFRAALHVHLVETSPLLRQRQRDTLASFDVPLAWYRDLADVPQGTALFMANEFFDALPVHQAVKAPDGWHERMVAWDGDRLAFAVHPAPLSDLAPALPHELQAAPSGALFEWRSDAVAREMSRRVVRAGGAALIIDYGHAESALGETLQAVSAHGFADPLERPGELDVTAHVDFGALARVALSEGARVHGPVPQGWFLHRLGIAERAAKLKSGATAAQAEAIDAALARLTQRGRTGMGELFKVTAFAHPALGDLPGFDR
ncbi:MAG: class I SAM-dependent methyltransferase [Xanthobacteraceae bacterium]